MQAWVMEELGSSDIGDERLDRRYQLLLDTLSQKPSVSIPAACNGWAETQAAYRFFASDRVDEESALYPHRDATLRRIAERDVVLLIQDTTEIDVTRPEQQMEGAGPLSDQSHLGFYCHPMLAVTPDRIPLGVVHADFWARDPEEFEENKKLGARGKQNKRKRAPIEEKESFRWLKGYREACAVAAETPNTSIVCISDSEGDIYECFAEAATACDDGVPEVHWVVRACQDRSLSSANDDPNWQKLWTAVAASKVRGTLEIEVSKNRAQGGDDRRRKQARSARMTTVTIQATRVTLKAPPRQGVQLPDVEVNAILVREVNPPKGEEPIEWLLLTSLPIGSFAKICLVIQYYCCRWQIEIYFRVLKSGCKVEDRQFASAERYKACLALYMIIAWRVMYVMMMGRACPDMPCDAVLTEDEWKAVYMIVEKKEPPKKVPSLGTMVTMIAKLGGYLARKHDGPPGPKAMWIGMQRMMDYAEAWRTFRTPPPANRARRICV
jgi:hypothetical protein